MSSTVHSLAILAASAAAGFAATLLCAWPAPIHAEGNGVALQEQAGLAAGSSKIGPLVAASRVVTVGGRCLVETRVRNPTEQRIEEVPIEADLYRTVSHPMARSMPMPTKVWQANHVVSVDGGAEIALRDALGPELCAQLTARAAPEAGSNASPMAMRPVTSFHTAVAGPQPSTAPRRDMVQRVVAINEAAAPIDALQASQQQRPQSKRSWAAPPPPQAPSNAQRQADSRGTRQRQSASPSQSRNRGGRNRI